LRATFRDEQGWRLPASYRDEKTEYSAVRDGGAGLIDLSSRGRLRVSGSEAVSFLNGLITNDMKTLAVHHSMPAVFPNVQGRLIAAVRVVRLSDDAETKQPVFLLDTEAARQEIVLKTIGRFTLAGDFRVADLTEATVQLSIQGKNAGAIVNEVLGPTVKDLSHDGAVEVDWQQTTVTVVRSTHTGEDGFDLISERSRAAELWDSLTGAGAQPVGHDALDVLRIEAGIPVFGRDMDETNVVTETNLDDSISFTKGCYIGQEIIIRIKHRGHVAKKLTGLVFDNSVKLGSGVVIATADGKEIGRITSATSSPRLGRTVALGYVRYEHLQAGNIVKVMTDVGEVSATVHELPFVRGSW
jgi:folate-binding protein YgfZ